MPCRKAAAWTAVQHGHARLHRGDLLTVERHTHRDPADIDGPANIAVPQELAVERSAEDVDRAQRDWYLVGDDRRDASLDYSFRDQDQGRDSIPDIGSVACRVVSSRERLLADKAEAE
jgi:hypothetical protein